MSVQLHELVGSLPRASCSLQSQNKCLPSHLVCDFKTGRSGGEPKANFPYLDETNFAHSQFHFITVFVFRIHDFSFTAHVEN